MEQGIGLGALIRNVRAELEQSRRREDDGKGGIYFKVSGLTVEVNVVITEGVGKKGGFDLKVVTLGAEIKLDTQRVHKVTLVMEPTRTPDFKSTAVVMHGGGRSNRV